MQFECIPHNQQKEAHFKQDTWKFDYKGLVLIHSLQHASFILCCMEVEGDGDESGGGESDFKNCSSLGGFS